MFLFIRCINTPIYSPSQNPYSTYLIHKYGPGVESKNIFAGLWDYFCFPKKSLAGLLSNHCCSQDWTWESGGHWFWRWYMDKHNKLKCLNSISNTPYRKAVSSSSCQSRAKCRSLVALEIGLRKFLLQRKGHWLPYPHTKMLQKLSSSSTCRTSSGSSHKAPPAPQQRFLFKIQTHSSVQH